VTKGDTRSASPLRSRLRRARTMNATPLLCCDWSARAIWPRRKRSTPKLDHYGSTRTRKSTIQIARLLRPGAPDELISAHNLRPKEPAYTLVSESIVSKILSDRRELNRRDSAV